MKHKQNVVRLVSSPTHKQQNVQETIGTEKIEKMKELFEIILKRRSREEEAIVDLKFAKCAEEHRLV